MTAKKKFPTVLLFCFPEVRQFASKSDFLSPIMSATRFLGQLQSLASTTWFRLPGVRAFSSTSMSQLRRRPSPKDLITQSRRELSPQTEPYSSSELAELRSHFSPEQLLALLAGEKAIDRFDFEVKSERRRGDPFGLNYLDDLSTIDPVLDFPLTPAGFGKEVIPRQNVPSIHDPELNYSEDDQEGDVFRKLSQRTGMPLKELRNLRTRLMISHSVTNQTRMGKIRKIYALAIAGNGNGLLGVGEGKSVESEDAIRQATYMAMRNMEPIPRYEGRTIYGDVEVKEGAVEMKLFTRPPGYCRISFVKQDVLLINSV